MIDLTELNKLEAYLKINKIPYKYIDHNTGLGRHQIIVFNNNGKRIWDAICQYGSYGAEQGLIEIMGSIVSSEKEDGVEGWLTSDDIISRIEVNDQT